MKIDAPSATHIPHLRSLWKEAFGDTDAFLDAFFSVAFSPDRCRCVWEDGRPVSALYWLDHTCNGEKYAYIYAVATQKSHRRQGLCHALMAHAHEDLAAAGYAGALLVPATEALAQYYAAMGYRFCAFRHVFTVLPTCEKTDLLQISTEEYLRLRGAHLPKNSALPDLLAMDFLSQFTHFYAGKHFLAAAQRADDHLYVPEFLGHIQAAPGILTALGASSGTFCTPGDDTPFAMYLPLKPETLPPTYLPFAFD
jgi:predicted N-acetyltransferase YhbS